jgi:putative ABC transport system permease protein
VRAEGIQWVRVVGVAPDVQYEEFGEETAQSQLNVYLPYSLSGSRSMAMLVRAEDPSAVAGSVRQALRAFAPGVPTYSFRTMEEVRYFTSWEERFFSRLFLAFALAALALAALGTYAVVAYRASRRAREIGVRMALGATRRAMLRMLLVQGSALAGLGLALGLPGSYAVSRLLEGSLYRVSAVNLGLYAVAACVLASAFLLASYLPARRAARVSPMAALRQE